MQIRPEQLEAQLARGLKPVYTIHGDEPLLAQEAGDAIRAAARAAGYTERQVFTVSGAHFDWSGVLGAAQAMSLFAEKQLIEIRIPSGKPGKEGSEMLQRYCEQLSDDVMTLVTLPRLDFQQLKAAWFAALDSHGTTVRVWPDAKYFESADLPRAELETRYAGPPSEFVDLMGLRLHVRDSAPQADPERPVVLMLHGGPLVSRIRVLAPMGRMALTNYLTQSLVCALYFHGYAFGQWGMPRAWQVVFVGVASDKEINAAIPRRNDSI
jgi:hypothetical protein